VPAVPCPMVTFGVSAEIGDALPLYLLKAEAFAENDREESRIITRNMKLMFFVVIFHLSFIDKREKKRGFQSVYSPVTERVNVTATELVDNAPAAHLMFHSTTHVVPAGMLSNPVDEPGVPTVIVEPCCVPPAELRIITVSKAIFPVSPLQSPA